MRRKKDAEEIEKYLKDAEKKNKLIEEILKNHQELLEAGKKIDEETLKKAIKETIRKLRLSAG